MVGKKRPKGVAILAGYGFIVVILLWWNSLAFSGVIEDSSFSISDIALITFVSICCLGFIYVCFGLLKMLDWARKGMICGSSSLSTLLILNYFFTVNPYRWLTLIVPMLPFSIWACNNYGCYSSLSYPVYVEVTTLP